MRRHPGIEHRPPRLALPLALFFALLLATSFARLAAAAPPTFVGTFTHSELCSPRGIALSASGDVLVGSDCLNPFMVRFTAAGSPLAMWFFAGGYQGSPNGVAVDGSGNIFVIDYEGGQVQKQTSAGILIVSFGSLNQPADVAVDASGNVYVSELSGRRVQKFSNGGAFLATIGSAGTAAGQFDQPFGVDVDGSGRLYVTDPGRGRILRFLANGAFDMEFSVSNAASDVAVGPDGNLYVVLFSGNQLLQYSLAGTLLTSVQSPQGMDLGFRIAISPTGALYLTEQNNNRIQRFQLASPTTAVRSTFGRVKALYR